MRAPRSSANSFRVAVADLRSRGAAPAVMRAVIEHADAADDEGVAHLARVLAASGRLADVRMGSCDVASTGGPSSLTTLLCPLFLRDLGYVIPKVGVPGRPAGAIDVLATVPGYQIRFQHDEFAAILAQAGFCHALASDELAPLDGALFALRRQLDAVATAPLVIASLLAKKIAVGIERVVLDVRVWPHGNFGRDLPEARARAARFCRIASLAGIRATCVLTDASRPYQPFIGRGESLLALEAVLYGASVPWLDSHVDLCHRIAAQASGGGASASRPSQDTLRAVFEAHIKAQGSSQAAFRTRVAEIASEATTVLFSRADGFVLPDLRAIRDVLVDLQATMENGDGFADPIGLRLLVDPDTFVRRGAPIARVRLGAPPGANVQQALRALSHALPVFPQPPPLPTPLEVVHSGTQ